MCTKTESFFYIFSKLSDICPSCTKPFNCYWLRQKFFLLVKSDMHTSVFRYLYDTCLQHNYMFVIWLAELVTTVTTISTKNSVTAWRWFYQENNFFCGYLSQRPFLQQIFKEPPRKISVDMLFRTKWSKRFHYQTTNVLHYIEVVQACQHACFLLYVMLSEKSGCSGS